MTLLLEKQVDRELKKLDADLFLDKEWYEGSLFYVVRLRTGETFLNVLPVEHLSLDVVLQVKSFEGDIMEAIAQVKAHNAALKESRRQEMVENLEDVAREHDKQMGKLRKFYH